MKALDRRPGIVGLGLAVVGCVLLLALPGKAPAAIQLGQVSPTPPIGCLAGVNGVQSATVAGLNYQVPAPGGVITSWSHRGISPGAAGSGRLQIWDSTGGNDFTLIGRSELEDFTAGLVTSFLTRIPVDPGDQLGLRTVEQGTGCITAAALGNVWSSTPAPGGAPDPEPGDVVTFPAFPGFLVDVAAVLEPDADADGFGDETQDACPDEAGPESGCPTPPPEPPQPQPPPPQQPPPGGPPPEALTLDLGAKKQKVKKKVKFSATANLASTLTAKGKKIKETTKQLAADEKTTVKAKLKRKARNRCEDKGKCKVKVTGTASNPTGTATDTVKVKLKD